jgi:protein ImuA
MAGDEHRAETLRALRQLCGKVARPVEAEQHTRLSLGIPALDALLPGGGLEPGSLVEWLAPAEGSGAATLALQGVHCALEQHLVWAVVDATGEFHPPVVRGWGVPLESLLLLRPSSVADAVWTVEQCLRCPAVGVTWFRAEHLPDPVLRRWKLAAEIGGGVGVLFRPDTAARRASWADVRWHAQPRPALTAEVRRVRVELLVCRGAFAGGSVELDVNDATGDVRLVSPVARATTAIRAAGA